MIDEMIERLENLYSKRDQLAVELQQLDEKTDRAAADSRLQEFEKVEAEIQSIEAALAQL